MSYEVVDFNREVIEASQNQPILVDFWAPWCAPCRTLSPTLEKLAAEAGDQWSLVTVNSDDHQDLSMAYQVRGIPAVKLFSGGEVIAEFTGAMPEYAVKQWLDQHLPSESSKSLAAVREFIGTGHVSEAVALLEEMESDPDARLLLASILALSDPDRAITLASSVVPSNAEGEVTKAAIQTVAGAALRSDEDLPEGPGRADFGLALKNLAAGDVIAAIEHLNQVLLKDRYYSDDAARRLGVAVFTLLGEGHPGIRELRRTFDMYLY